MMRTAMKIQKFVRNTPSHTKLNPPNKGSKSPTSVVDMRPFSTARSDTKPIPIPEKTNAPIPGEKMALFINLAHDKIFNDPTIPNAQKIEFASLFRSAWHAYTEEMIDGFIEGRISVKAFIAMLPPLKPCFFDVHAPQ